MQLTDDEKIRRQPNKSFAVAVSQEIYKWLWEQATVLQMERQSNVSIDIVMREIRTKLEASI
ncbi:MAG: hypothetical protein ACXW1D_09365 [Halobacteriota archaeon]